MYSDESLTFMCCVGLNVMVLYQLLVQCSEKLDTRVNCW